MSGIKRYMKRIGLYKCFQYYMLILITGAMFGGLVACGTAEEAPKTYSQRSPDKEFSAFGFVIDSVQYAGSVNNSTREITVTVPSSVTTLDGTSATAGKISPAIFSITGFKVTVNDVVQESGQTYQNYTSSVVYRVYAADNTYADYTVTVSIVSAVPSAPVASSVNITGFTKEGQTLTGNYTYTDANGDPNQSTFQWYRCTAADGSGATIISGATLTTYTLQAADIGAYIAFRVTPETNVEPFTGTAVTSTAVGPVVSAATNTAPTITGVTLSGSPFMAGNTITATATGYSDLEGDSAGTHQYQWYLATDNAGTGSSQIGGATSNTYTILAGDAGKYLACSIKPVDSIGAVGTAVFSSWNVISAADSTPPSWMSSYPQITDIQSTSANLKLDIDESGTAYWIVVASGSTAPTAAQVMAMTTYGGVTVVTSGTAAKTTTLTTHALTGLTVGVTYDVYCVAKDIYDNIQSDATVVASKVSFTTTADSTPPVWSPGYPAIDTITETTARLKLDIDESGTAYWIVVAAGSTTPTAAQVKARVTYSGVTIVTSDSASKTTTASNHTLSSLSAGVNYDVYCVAEDSLGNIQSDATVSSSKVTFTTVAADSTPPSWVLTPEEGTMGGTTAQVRASINEAGKLYAVLLTDGATAPSAAQVKAGQNSTSTSLALGYVASNTSVNANTTTALDFSATLSSSTAYDVYIVAEDNIGNLQASATLVNVTTINDTTPPTWSTAPAQGTMGSTTGQVTAAISEAGKMYAVILANGATAPSYAQVKAGQDGSGGALAAGFKASNTSVAATTLTTLSFSGLTASTAYDVYIAAEDNAGTPNTLGPTKVDVTTGAGGSAWQHKIEIDLTSTGDLYGVVQDSSGNVYAHCSTKIRKYDSSGSLVWISGASVVSANNSANGGISIDSNGRVYIPNGSSGDIQRLSADGNTVESILGGDLGTTRGVFVSGDGDNGSAMWIIQTDATDRGVIKYLNVSGVWTKCNSTEWGTNGVATSADLNTYMKSVFVGSDGNVYVTTGSTAFKLLKISIDGDTVTDLTIDSTYFNSGSCVFLGLTQSLSPKIYVPILLNTSPFGEIRKYSNTGNLEETLSTLNVVNGVFPGSLDNKITGISASSDGNTIWYAIAENSGADYRRLIKISYE